MEHHDAPVLGLDTHECVRGVVCEDDFLHVTLCNHSTAQHVIREFQQGGLVAGGQEWNCMEDGEGVDAKVLLRKVVGAPQLSASAPHTLVFRTEQAKYTDFFKSSKIRFHTNIYEEPDQVDYEQPTHAQAQAGLRRLRRNGTHSKPSSNWFAQGWSKIAGLGRSVKSAINTVKAAAKILTTGKFKKSLVFAKRQWGWNCTFPPRARWQYQRWPLVWHCVSAVLRLFPCVRRLQQARCEEDD